MPVAGHNLTVIDVECLPNYFSLGCLSDTRLVVYEIARTDIIGNPDVGWSRPWDKRAIHHMFRTEFTAGFNSAAYDMMLVRCALSGMNTQELYEMSQRIMRQRLREFMLDRLMDLEPLPCRHADLAEIAPGRAEEAGAKGFMEPLKLYAARLGEDIQDFPLDYHKPITRSQRCDLCDYNVVDLRATMALAGALEGEIQLRFDMSKAHGVDMLKKSDAKMAEAVIRTEVAARGQRVGEPDAYRQGKVPLVARKAQVPIAPHIRFRSEGCEAFADDCRSFEAKWDAMGMRSAFPSARSRSAAWASASAAAACIPPSRACSCARQPRIRLCRQMSSRTTRT